VRVERRNKKLVSTVADKVTGETPGADVRVCVVTPYLPAPSETFIRGHVEGLPARVTLVHSWPPSVGVGPVLSPPARAWHKAVGLLTGRGAREATTAGYVAAFRRARAEAVLAEYGTTGVDVMEACGRLGLPLVVHFHGYDASVRSVLEENAETYPRMFKSAAAVVAVSRAMQRKLVELGAPADKVHYNPCGIDCRKFSGADPASAPPVLLAVGRFVEKKAPQLTLRAFAAAHEVRADARLRMIGDGPLLDECRALARSLDIGDAVTFLGAQPHEVVGREMRAARGFVQHSVEASNGDCEGTPVGILEACASGLPVVATRHAGIVDVIAEGQTGFLVDERDVDGMSRHVLRLIEEPELAGRLGRAARQRIEGQFSMEDSFGRLWTIIEACIPKRQTEAREALTLNA
jgi:colanic acid/amylovoran biosynthesis glycosyltransferase